MARNVHFSRLLDIISGSIFASARNKTEQDKLFKDFDVSKLNDKTFRDLVTANLPAFYVVKPSLVAKEAVHALKTRYKETISGIGIPTISNGVSSLEDISSPENSDFNKRLEEILKGDLEVKLTLALAASLEKKFSKHAFLTVYSSIEKIYESMLKSFTVKKGYVGYRNAAATYGNKLRTLLSSKGIFIATDATKVLEGLSTSDMLLICPTFSSAVRTINETMQKAAEEYLLSIGISTTKYDAKKNPKAFTIGSLANAGHTSAKVGKDILGINTPLSQKTQFISSGSPLSFEVEKSLSSIPLHVSHAVQFKQDYRSVGTSLLDMQFSFVVSQDFQTNNKLSTEELARVKAVVGNLLLPTIKDQAISKLSGGIIDPTEYGSSPSYLEYLEQAILASIRGEKVANHKKKSTVTKSTTISIPVLIDTKGKNKLSVSVKSGTSNLKVSIPKLRNTQTGRFTSLANLQSLLSQALTEQVKKNMGKGNRKDILNLRSGRFAESVKVERMSQSREGMITAFYSYMKYPYQTFEPGFKQGRPTTRDPKLLISKSIREIAATMVGNKLRAVRL